MYRMKSFMRNPVNQIEFLIARKISFIAQQMALPVNISYYGCIQDTRIFKAKEN